MKNPLLRLVSLALCLSGLVGCTSHGTLGGIAVTVVAVKPAAPPAPETQAVLTLQFANENVASVATFSMALMWAKRRVRPRRACRQWRR